MFKPTSALSGGERSRLALARLLITEPNMLILDEPTTHLDIPSREVLEAALQTYSGTLLFVSHDRRLISRLATQLWIVEDGEAQMFKGGFEQWIRGRQPVTPTQAAAPASGSRSRQSNKQRRTAGARQRAKQAVVRDYEALIGNLEAQLAEINAALESATERQNVAEITRLGKKYTATQASLEQAWNDWSEVS